MLINVKNRTKPAAAAPYAEQIVKPRKQIQWLAMLFVGLAGYWASFFQGESAEAATAPDSGKAPDIAAGLPADASLRSATGAAAEPELAYPAPRAPMRSAEAQVHAETSALTQLSSVPEPMARAATGAAPAHATDAVPTSLVQLSGSAPAAPGGRSPTPSNADLAEATAPVPSALPETDVYSITDLLADMLENTDSLGSDFKATLLELATDDWLSAQALHSLLNGAPDLSLAGFIAQEKVFAELLRNPGQRDAVIENLLGHPPATPDTAALDLALSGGTTTLTADAAQPLI